MKRMVIVLGLMVIAMFVISCAPTGEGFYNPRSQDLLKKEKLPMVPKTCAGAPTGKSICINKVIFDNPKGEDLYSVFSLNEYYNKDCSINSKIDYCGDQWNWPLQKEENIVWPLKENDDSGLCGTNVGCCNKSPWITSCNNDMLVSKNACRSIPLFDCKNKGSSYTCGLDENGKAACIKTMN